MYVWLTGWLAGRLSCRLCQVDSCADQHSALAFAPLRPIIDAEHYEHYEQVNTNISIKLNLIRLSAKSSECVVILWCMVLE